LTAFFCYFCLDLTWAHLAPTSPNPAEGLIYSHAEHGAVTYFSAFQATSEALLFATSIPLAFIGFFIVPKRRRVARRGCLSFAGQFDSDDPNHVGPIGSYSGVLSAPLVVFVLGPPLINWLNAHAVVLSFG
jgi:hypothetical protein